MNKTDLNLDLYEKIPFLKNRFSIKCKEYKHNTVRPHWHEHIELLYFFKAEGHFICNGKAFSLSDGDLAVINSTEIHSLSLSGDSRFLCILIYPDFFNDVKFNHKLIIRNVIHHDDFISDIVKKISEHSKSESFGADMSVKGNTYMLMAYLLKKHLVTQLSADREFSNSKRLKKIDAVFKYISENYQRKITTRELADLCFVTEAHLCRFFKNSVGKTPIEFINEFRIEKSLVLLTETEESITDIAFKVGFSDSNYFTRTFKKFKNTTPGKYRQTQNKL